MSRSGSRRGLKGKATNISQRRQAPSAFTTPLQLLIELEDRELLDEEVRENTVKSVEKVEDGDEEELLVTLTVM